MGSEESNDQDWPEAVPLSAPNPERQIAYYQKLKESALAAATLLDQYAEDPVVLSDPPRCGLSVTRAQQHPIALQVYDWFHLRYSEELCDFGEHRYLEGHEFAVIWEMFVDHSEHTERLHVAQETASQIAAYLRAPYEPVTPDHGQDAESDSTGNLSESSIAEQEDQQAPTARDKGDEAPAKRLMKDEVIKPTHDEHFRVVDWFGREYRFTEMQSKAVALLWKKWNSDHPCVTAADIMDEVDSKRDSVSDIFKDSEAWNSMIRYAKGDGGKGMYRLVPPDEAE